MGRDTGWTMALAETTTAGSRGRSRDGWHTLRWPALWIAGSAVLGVAMSESAAVAALQAGLVVLYAIWACVFSRRIETAVWAASYIAACDVLWRMTKVPVPWEAGKWGLVAVLVAIWLRWQRQLNRASQPLLFIALLIPSAAITAVQLAPGDMREALSFNLGAAIALAAGVIVLRQITSTESETARVMWVLLGPTASICAIATWVTLRSEHLRFGSESNSLAAGGFGPNQVSTMLGLGALLCLLLAMRSTTVRQRLLVAVIGVWFAGQGFTTLSRGGMYAFVIAGGCTLLTGLVISGRRSRAVMVLVGAGLALLLAFSWVDGFTEGSLGDRYEDTGSTGRGEIFAADVELWGQNPVWGVGVGMSGLHRQILLQEPKTVATHTEHSRMVAEHGTLGFLALVVLVTMAVSAYRHALGQWNRLLVVGLVVWVFVSMSHAATRVAAVPMVFALANLRTRPDESVAARAAAQSVD